MENKYIIGKEYQGGKREILKKDELLMLQAIMASLYSKDPATQTGACIVDKNGNIITTGYNHNPKYWNEDEFPWNGDVKNNGEENTKYPYVIHAEMDALINYKGNNEDFIGSTLYVTLFPCSNCAKHLADAGIKRVIYLFEREETIDKIEVKRIFEACGIEYYSFSEITSELEGIEFNLTIDEKHTSKKLVRTNN